MKCCQATVIIKFLFLKIICPNGDGILITKDTLKCLDNTIFVKFQVVLFWFASKLILPHLLAI